MTDKNLNIPKTQTYEVKYIDLTVKEPSKISKIASFLGVKTVDCSGKEVSKAEQDKKLKEIEDRTEAIGKGAKKSGAKGKFSYKEESGNKKTGDYSKKKATYETKNN